MRRRETDQWTQQWTTSKKRLINELMNEPHTFANCQDIEKISIQIYFFYIEENVNQLNEKFFSRKVFKAENYMSQWINIFIIEIERIFANIISHRLHYIFYCFGYYLFCLKYSFVQKSDNTQWHVSKILSAIIYRNIQLCLYLTDEIIFRFIYNISSVYFIHNNIQIGIWV